MKYVSASDILPDDLLLEVQKYVQGKILYIPSPKEYKKKVGTKYGSERTSSETKHRDSAIISKRYEYRSTFKFILSIT